MAAVLVADLAIAAAPRAEVAELVVSFDLDRNTNSGCSNATPDGTVFGVELVLRSVVDLETREVSSVTHASCLDGITNEFGAALAVGGTPNPPWSVVVGDGTSGSTLIETRLPLSLVPTASAVEAYISLSAAAGSDALLTLDGTASGAAIRIVLRPLAIPALQAWELTLLALALIGVIELAGRRRVRRPWLRAALLFAAAISPVLVHAGLGDGSLRTWSVSERVATDLSDDAPVGVDILAAFAAVDTQQEVLFIRVDALLAPAMCLAWPTVDPGSGYACRQDPPPDSGPFGLRVALTFDDGPNLATTPLIVATLRSENIPATFFVQGSRLDDSIQTMALVREIHDDPLFEIANHSYNHPGFTTLTDEQARVEVTSATDLIRLALDDPCYFPRYFRFPYSSSSCANTAVVREQGHSIVGLHIDALDWCYAMADGFCPPSVVSGLAEIYRSDMVGWVVFKVQQTSGGVVLMHDIHPNTVLQLPAVIAALRAAGVTFVRLDDVSVFPLIQAAIHAPEPPACCDGVVRY